MKTTIRFVPLENIETDGAGHKIPVIKSIRALTGFGLKDAKDIADSLYGSFERIAENCEVCPGENEREHINALKSYGVLASFKSREHLEELISHTKECLNLCTEHEEANLLEVYSVVFKMLMEK